MEMIVASIKQVADIMSDISMASDEQRVGIEEVGRAITQMDEMTQQNASMVEQAAAATDSMRQEAQLLADATAIFKLPGDPQLDAVTAGTHRAPRVAPPRRKALENFAR